MGLQTSVPISVETDLSVVGTLVSAKGSSPSCVVSTIAGGPKISGSTVCFRVYSFVFFCFVREGVWGMCGTEVEPLLPFNVLVGPWRPTVAIR